MWCASESGLIQNPGDARAAPRRTRGQQTRSPPDLSVCGGHGACGSPKSKTAGHESAQHALGILQDVPVPPLPYTAIRSGPEEIALSANHPCPLDSQRGPPRCPRSQATGVPVRCNEATPGQPCALFQYPWRPLDHPTRDSLCVRLSQSRRRGLEQRAHTTPTTPTMDKPGVPTLSPHPSPTLPHCPYPWAGCNMECTMQWYPGPPFLA